LHRPSWKGPLDDIRVGLHWNPKYDGDDDDDNDDDDDDDDDDDNDRSTELDGAHSPPKPLDPNGRSVNANESVHYHHCSNGYSCHSRVEPVTVSDLGVTSVDANKSVHYNHFNDGDSCHGCVEWSLCPPSWVHVFGIFYSQDGHLVPHPSIRCNPRQSWIVSLDSVQKHLNCFELIMLD